MPQPDDPIDFNVVPVAVEHDCTATENEVALIKARVEGTLMLLIGIGVAFTPGALIWVSYLTALNKMANPVDPQITTYCLVSAGAVVAYFFGKGLINQIGKK